MRILTFSVETDTFETYFDSHVDLFQRKIQKQSERLKMKAAERFKIKDLSGDLLAENLDKELKEIKLKVRAPRVFGLDQVLTVEPHLILVCIVRNPHVLVSDDMAVCASCQDPRESLLFLRCHELTVHCLDFWPRAPVRHTPVSDLNAFLTAD